MIVNDIFWETMPTLSPDQASFITVATEVVMLISPSFHGILVHDYCLVEFFLFINSQLLRVTSIQINHFP